MSDGAKGGLLIAGFCGFFLVFGGLGLFDVAVEARRGRASLAWPTAQGEIVRSDIVRGRRSGEAVIRYAYTVDGRAYEGWRKYFIRRGDGRTRSDWVRQYPEGRTVPVHYDPDDPEISALEPGASLWGIVRDGFAATLITLIGGLGTGWGLRKAFD